MPVACSGFPTFILQVCARPWTWVEIILDVIKYYDHPRWYEKNTSRRWTSDWRVRSPIGGGTSDWRCHSNWRWDLQLEVRSPIGGPTSNWSDTSNQMWDLQLEVRSPIGGPTSNQRSPLQLEVTPPIRGGGDTSDWRWDL